MLSSPTGAEGACHLGVPPDPGIQSAALGAGEAAALGAHASPAPGVGEAAALGSSESPAPGAGESALSGAAPAAVLHTFTLDSGASRSFRDRTTLTTLSRPVAVSLAHPSGGPPAPTCVPCVEGRQRAASHSFEFPPTEAPLQTLHMDVWGPARVRGQGHERFFLLVVDDYSRYTIVFPLRRKGEVTETFTLPASPQKNGIAERRIGMVIDVARTSMIHAAAPHFLWPYAAHQINLQPRVSMPETSPAFRWTGKVGDASVFRVWGSRAFLAVLPPVLYSQDVTFDESVPYYRLFPYRLFPYRTAPLPPPPLFLAPGPPPVDPLPPQGPAPSGVSQVDAVEPVEVAVDSGAARGAEPERAEPGGAGTGGAESRGAEPGDAGLGGPSGASSRREPFSPQKLHEWFARRWRRTAGAGGASGAGGSAAAGGPSAAGATGGSGATGPRGACTGGTGATGPGGATRAGAAGGAGAGGAVGGAAGGVGAGGAAGARAPVGAVVGATGAAGGAAGAVGADAGGAGAVPTGAGTTGPGGASTGGTGAAGTGGAPGARAAGVVGAGGPAGAGASRGAAVGGAAGASAPEGAGVGATRAAGAATGAGGAARVGADAVGAGAVPAGSGGATRPRPYFVPFLDQVLGLPPSTDPPPSFECSPPVQSESQLQPASPLPAPSSYTRPTGGLAECREPTVLSSCSC
ncbi:unnamed protein product [Closterium sp. NIES-64]|nr:unnamed protein product [Closterium sp. NIES-64]